MNQRVYQVYQTYLQRWNVWILTAGYCVACGIAIGYSWFLPPVEFQTNVYQRMVNVAPEFPQPAPLEHVVGQQLEAVSRKCRSIYWNADARQPAQPAIKEPFSKLVSLQIVGSLKSSDGLQPLRSMPNLEAFSLIGDGGADNLTDVTELTKLRYLRLPHVDNDVDLASLRKLRQLQTFDVLGVKDHARLFEELSHIPSLRTLVVPGQIVAVFQAADWERLRALPHLRELFLRGNLSGPVHSRMELDQIQQILPHVKVRPCEVVESRANAWCYISLASILVWGMLSIQLQSQFAHSGACLIPDYAKYHIRTAVSIWSIATAISSVIMWRGGCSLAASLAGILIFPGMLSWWVAMLLQPSRKGNHVAILNPIFGLCLCFPFLMFTPMLSRYFLSDIDWFLQGRQPIRAWVIVAISLAGSVLALRRLPRLYSLYQESLAGSPPLGVNPKEWATWSKSVAGTPRKPKGPLKGLDPTVCLDALLAAPRSQHWSRLWNAANGVNLPQICMSLLVTSAIALGLLYGITSLGILEFDWQQLRQWSVMMGWFCLEGSSLGLILIWRGRRPSLGYELLRPFSRQEFVRQLFSAVFCNLWPLLALHLLAMSAFLFTLGFERLPPLFIPAGVCYCLLRGLSFYLAILFLLATPRNWVVAVGLILLYLCDAMAGAYFMLAYVNPEKNLGEVWFPELAIALLLAGCVAAVLGLNWLKGHWQRIELA